MTLRGTYTALVTPFNTDGSVDFGALNALIDWQIEGNITGFVPCGTTGEAATLSADERFAVIEAVAKRAADRPVIAGTGTNSTTQSLELHRRAAGHGATHSLAVTPYYNKPTPTGLLAHYRTLADEGTLPIVLYNVPGRTGCDLQPQTVIALAEHPRIVAVKEAVGDVNRIAFLRKHLTDDFSILSGDDPTAAAVVLFGADGVVSVTSNLTPNAMGQLINTALNGNLDELRRRHTELLPLHDALFIESNPIPLKAALAMKGLIQENYRLPLAPMDTANRRELETTLRQGQWI